jgi:hypothetical protein
MPVSQRIALILLQKNDTTSPRRTALVTAAFAPMHPAACS